jgi:TRAP-type C4-dicarboxylate transport system permease small subunit
MNILNLNQFVNKILIYLLIFFMSTMVLTVVWQVFTRFVINDPSVFTDELSRYLLIWIGILGGAYTYSVKRHLALELIMPHLNFVNKQLLSIFINLLVILFCAVTFVYGGSSYVMDTLQYHQVSPGLTIGGYQLLIGYVYIVVPLSGVLIIYYGVLDIVDSMMNIFLKRTGEEQ